MDLRSGTLFFRAATVLLLLSFGVNGQTPQATPPPPSAPRPLTIPAAVEKTLSNGLRVIVIQRSNTPLVTAQVVIKNGAETDPRELAGLAHLTASLLTLGTSTRNATQIAEAIDALGGTLTSGALWDAAAISVEVMSSQVDPAMQILGDVVRRPTFKDEEIERLRQQYIDFLNVQLGEPDSVASFAAQRVLFGDAPYGHPLGGTPESLKRIRRNDILRLNSALYRPDNAILVIGGDIGTADAFGFAEKYFGDWRSPATGRVLRPLLAVGRPAGNKQRVLVIDKPDADQAAVVLTRIGLNRSDPDFFRGLVTNSVLDGYSGRLNQEIRIKRGLSYGAGSTIEARRDVGPFVAAAQTRNEAAAQVAELLLREVNRLGTVPVTEAELVPRKAVLIGNFARELEEVNGLVSDLSFLALLGLSLTETNSFVTNVQSVTAGELQKFAAARLNTRGVSIVIVGNARKFLPELQKKFKGVEVIPIKELDLNHARLRKSWAAKPQRKH
jgi:zinc protease